MAGAVECAYQFREKRAALCPPLLGPLHKLSPRPSGGRWDQGLTCIPTRAWCELF